MEALNALLRSLFDLLLAPAERMSPVWPLLVVSVATAVFALYVLKYLSNQTAMARTKDRMFAGIFEVRLHNDDLPRIFSATGSILVQSLKYIWLAFWPAMLIILVPVLLVIAQLQFVYGYQGLEPGDAVLLKVELVPPDGAEAFEVGAAKPSASLELPAGLLQASPAVWIPSLSQLAWEVEVDAPGSWEIGVTVGGETVTKSLVASESWVRRSPVRHDGGFWDQLLFPAEASLPSGSGIASITTDYPTATFPFLFIDWNWLIFYLVAMLVIGFALAKPLKVTV